jgi:hypothetical protein
MEHLLDVSALEPCEPLEKSLAAARALGPGEQLRILHRREPRPLFALLEQGGFAWECSRLDESRYEIKVWRRNER